VLLQEGEATLSTLYRLRELGIRIAMDDFGTGYSSLSYLQSFPFDKIKIDRSFVEDVTSPRPRLLVEAVIDLTGKLGLVQIAEGIEDRPTRDQLIELGCRYGQGYLFHRPAPLWEQVPERTALSLRE
jgi:EAL domain-containing protein (putative c-di-GMP-specific phosphodiesterase class I)